MGGNLWFGTSDGLLQWNPSTEDFVILQNNPEDEDSLSHNRISDILEDRSGDLWISTEGGGLNRLTKDREHFERITFEPIKTQTSTSGSHLLTSLFQDRFGRFWVGSWGAGLYQFDPQTGQWI